MTQRPMTMQTDNPTEPHLFAPSFAQERLWFLDRMEPGNPFYNVPSPLRLTGLLDVEVLRRSLAEIMRRHEPLRTTFHQEDGRPIQRITAAAELALPLIDLGELPAAEQLAELKRRIHEESRRPFDLERGPLLRASLLRLDVRSHVLLLVMHHIVSDGWSLGVLYRELGALYAAFARGDASPLGELSIQYADFAHWQRELLGGVLDKQLAYWKRQLADASPLHALPLDRPRPVVQSYRGEVEPIALSRELTSALQRIAEQHGATLFMVLLATLATVLSRYQSRRDIIIGTPIANRNRSELEPLVGFFVNILPIRVDLDEALTFDALLARVRAIALEAYANQDQPFEKLVEELRPERSMAHSPLVQIVFALQNAPAPPLSVPGLELRQMEYDSGHVRFELELHLWAVPEGLGGCLLYKTDLFEAATARRLIRHFEHLLASVAADAGARVSSLAMLPDDELRRLVADFSMTRLTQPVETIPELFARQAASRPDAVALVAGERRMTYSELDAHANRLAWRLRALGVGPDGAVALYTERSFEMIIGLLGILKAGGAYVPLAVADPVERKELLLAEVGARIVLTQSHLMDGLPSSVAIAIAIDEDDGPDGATRLGPPSVGLRPDHLAYVLFTSGTTDRPKAVAVPHRAVVRLAKATDYVSLGESDVLLQMAPLAFDASTFEIWCSLLNGARLTLMPPQAPTLAEIGAAIRVHGVTTLWLTAGLFQVMVEERLDDLRPLRTLLAGGDVLPVPAVRRVLESLPGCRLINGYGPTENTTFTCCHPVLDAKRVEPSVPIGRPISDTSVYILDAWMRVVPVGVTGELYTGGAGLARGYLNRPDLTAESFVPNAFTDDPGARLYRTGDLARYLPDGTIVFMGRADEQVKLRGFRIEPAAVEHALKRDPGVKQALVMVRQDTPGDKALVAYIVPAESVAGADAKGLLSEQIGGWKELFDQTIYLRGDAIADPLFNTTGWVSTYDDRPIPVAQMRVWAADIVDRVRARRPRRVLEIGCGTGMLLFQLAPDVELYHGTDFSQVSLDYVRARLAELGPRFASVKLTRQLADDFTGIEEGSFDAVILSSVVQYFPTLDYLLDVLASSVRVVRPGGFVLLGDVRSHPLLESYHASVLRSREPELGPADFARRLRSRIAQETELTVAPDFFTGLPRRLAKISRTELHLERGREHNELNLFRYHAILHVGPPEAATVAPEPFAGQTPSLDDLGEHLRRDAPDGLCVRGIANARLSQEAAAIDPADLWDLGTELGYAVDVGWSAIAPAAGCLDVVFTRAGAPRQLAAADALVVDTRVDTLANAPLRSRTHARLLQRLGEQLKGALPGYMVPSAFVVLDELPLNVNGKVDRAALPAPERGTTDRFVPPRSAEEEVLCALWASLLGVPRVGVHDDFFELGGHSLLATQVVSRVHEQLGVELPLRSFFSGPTVAGLAAQIAAVRREQKGPGDGEALPTIVPDLALRSLPFPLNEIQQAYWLGRSGVFELGDVAAHIYFEIDGEGVDLERYGRVWERLIERHDMLRMVIQQDGMQRILPEVPPYRIAVQDLRGASAAEQAARLAATRAEMSHQVLAADQWPLFDIRASVREGGQVRLHMSFDALMADAHSLSLVFRESYALYQKPDWALPPLTLSFRDYVLAEEQLRATPRYRLSRDYWWARLDDLPPAPELPLAHDPALMRQPRFQAHQHVLEPEIWRALRTRGQAEGLTPSGLLVACFAEVLGAFCQSPRFTINLTMFRRLPLHPEVNDILGDFTSLVLLAVDHRTREPFRVRAARLQKQLWEDMDHSYVSGVSVLRELRRRRGSAPGAMTMPVVFTSTLGLGSVGPALPEMVALGDPGYASSQTPQVWLDHGVTERDDHLILLWNAAEELFPPGLIRSMLAAYVDLLRQLASSDRAWSEVGRVLAPAGELAQRATVNATEAPMSRELLHTRFLRQASERGEATAIIAPELRLTYAELELRSRALGTALRESGIGPGALVAVVMEKGWEQIVAVLAILRAGGAYLPLDAGLPPERTRRILASAGVTLVVTQPHVDASRAWPPQVHRLAVTNALRSAGGAFAEAARAPGDLAYVIYTSGSTGEPKGVMVSHEGAVNTLLDINERFGVGAADRVLALSSLGFDLSVWDVFGVLGAGGALVLPEPREHPDPDHWRALAAREDVTIWNTVPALAEIYASSLESANATGPSSLRLFLLSGDWIPLGLPDRLRALAPRARVISLGGATEASIWSICHPIERVDPAWRSIPYGLPLRNQRFHVLATTLEPCPVWVPGELYIGGAGLALGYLGDEARTRERFISHPDTGERLYRTGDRGRYLPDGEIEFLGRDDGQVKVAGHRVELGEIKAALLQHPLVKDAVVIATGERFENKKLAAYVVTVRGAEAPPREVPDGTHRMTPEARVAFTLQRRGLRRDLGTGLALDPRELRRDLFFARRSHRRFDPAAVQLAALGGLLSSLAACSDPGALVPKYRYASPGGLYPVQTYVYVKPDRVTGLQGGTYYYHPCAHQLVPIADGVGCDAGAHAAENRPIFESSAFWIFLVADLDAIEPLYGDATAGFISIEAGLMSQLLDSEAPQRGLGLCQIGSFDPTLVRPQLRLGERHAVVHSMLGGGALPADAVRAEEKKRSFPDPGAELADFLHTQLPAYMVPTTIRHLDALPLTPNGKVDLAALPRLVVATQQRLAPEGELESKLAAMLGELLAIAEPGVEQGFFELGAHSMDVVQYHRRLTRELGIELPLVEMFQHASVRALAAFLSRPRDDDAARDDAEARAARRKNLQRRRTRGGND